MIERRKRFYRCCMGKNYIELHRWGKPTAAFIMLPEDHIGMHDQASAFLKDFTWDL